MKIVVVEVWLGVLGSHTSSGPVKLEAGPCHPFPQTNSWPKACKRLFSQATTEMKRIFRVLYYYLGNGILRPHLAAVGRILISMHQPMHALFSSCRQGIATSLLDASEKLVSRLPRMDGLYLHARLEDQAALNLYKGRGYTEVKKDSPIIVFQGIRPRVLMRKLICDFS
jgi:hypothetical protein